MTWVVDASIAVKWVIPEVLSDNADRVRDGEDNVLAPERAEQEHHRSVRSSGTVETHRASELLVARVGAVDHRRAFAGDEGQAQVSGGRAASATSPASAKAAAKRLNAST